MRCYAIYLPRCTLQHHVGLRHDMTCPTHSVPGCNHTYVSHSHTDFANMFLCNDCCLACSKTHALFTCVGLAAAIVLCAVTSCSHCSSACMCMCACVCSVVCAGYTSNLQRYRHRLTSRCGVHASLGLDADWMQRACWQAATAQMLQCYM
jgi:hypothetical protein